MHILPGKQDLGLAQYLRGTHAPASRLHTIPRVNRGRGDMGNVPVFAAAQLQTHIPDSAALFAAVYPALLGTGAADGWHIKPTYKAIFSRAASPRSRSAASSPGCIVISCDETFQKTK